MNVPTPGLKDPAPGLRTVHYDAQSAGKVNLIVRPGDVLIVSEDVAGQLAASSSQFKDVTPGADEPQTSTNTDTTTPPVEVSTGDDPPPPSAKRAARKRSAKPKD